MQERIFQQRSACKYKDDFVAAEVFERNA